MGLSAALAACCPAPPAQVFRTLPTQPYCRGLAFDPEGEFVAVANADGTLSVWAVANGKAEATFRKAGPKVGPACAGLCWLLAIRRRILFEQVKP